MVERRAGAAEGGRGQGDWIRDQIRSVAVVATEDQMHLYAAGRSIQPGFGSEIQILSAEDRRDGTRYRERATIMVMISRFAPA